MPMTVAELFVSLGIKGGKDVVTTLSGVQNGLQKTAEMSWAAKAGIFAAVVGLEEMTRFAVGTAVDLKNFSGATGLSTESLQRWGYVARMNNVSFDELSGTIRGLQSAQAKMAMGQGAPAGALFFGLDPNKNPLELFDQIAKKIRATRGDQRSIGVAREMAASLGISENMFAMLRTGQMSMAGFTKEMALTGAEQQKLLGLDRQWSRFWMTIKGLGQKTVANDLAEPITGFVHILTDDVKEINRLADDLKKAFKKMDSPELETTLKAIGAALLIALAPLAPYTAALVALGAILEDLHKYREGKDSVLGMFMPGNQTDADLKKQVAEDKKKHGAAYRFFFGQTPAEMELGIREYERQRAGLVGPVAPAPATAPNVNVTNHIEVNGAPHPEAVAHAVGRHIKHAVTQSSALTHTK